VGHVHFDFEAGPTIVVFVITVVPDTSNVFDLTEALSMIPTMENDILHETVAFIQSIIFKYIAERPGGGFDGHFVIDDCFPILAGAERGEPAHGESQASEARFRAGLDTFEDPCGHKILWSTSRVILVERDQLWGGPDNGVIIANDLTTVNSQM